MDEEVTAQTTPLHIVLSHFALSLSLPSIFMHVFFQSFFISILKERGKNKISFGRLHHKVNLAFLKWFTGNEGHSVLVKNGF